MKLASAGNLEGVGVVGVLDTERNIRVQLTVQTVSEMTGGDKLAFLPGKWTVVDTEVHGNGRILDLLERNRVRCAEIADGISNMQVLDSGKRDDGAH